MYYDALKTFVSVVEEQSFYKSCGKVNDFTAKRKRTHQKS